MPDEDIDPNGDDFLGTFDDTDDDDEFIYEDDLEGSSDFDKEYEFDDNMYEDNASKRWPKNLTTK